jgi:hypothetical protein
MQYNSRLPPPYKVRPYKVRPQLVNLHLPFSVSVGLKFRVRRLEISIQREGLLLLLLPACEKE